MYLSSLTIFEVNTVSILILLTILKFLCGNSLATVINTPISKAIKVYYNLEAVTCLSINDNIYNYNTV